MTLTGDNPILNSPFRKPERYWLDDAAGMPRVENGWRQAAARIVALDNSWDGEVDIEWQNLQP